MRAIKFIFLILPFGLAACATTTFKETMVRNMVVGGAAGFVVGNQKDENKSAYATMYAGIGAAAAALYTTYANDPDKEIAAARAQSRELSKSMDQFQDQRSHSRDDLTSRGQALRSYDHLPQKYRSLINPGEWRLYEIDEWEKIDDTKLVHKTEMVELIPPNLNTR